MSYFFDEISKFIENLSDGNKVYFSEQLNYILSDNQSGIDFAKEIRIDAEFYFMFKTDDVDKLISLESVFTEQISKGIKLSDITDESTLQEATLSVDLEQISRGKAGDEEYYCVIPAVCKNIVLQKRIENPIKVELDNKTQIQLMKHLSILNLAYEKMGEHREEIQQQITEMFNFQKICTGILSCSDDSFIKCYKIMIDKRCNIAEATKLFYTEKENARKRAEEERRKKIEEEKRRVEEAERRKAEEERKDKRLRNIYSTIGDTEMNRHTDLIVRAVQSKMGDIQVYGGSSMSEFLLEKYENRLRFPCVVIRDDAEFAILSPYTNTTKNNNTVLRDFTPNDYSMRYKAVIQLYVSNKTQLDYFYIAFQSMVGLQTIIAIPSLSYVDEYHIFKLELPSPDKELEINTIEYDGRKAYYYELNCLPQTIIYHTYIITEDITYNQRLQFRLLQRMQHILRLENMLTQIGISEIDNEYSRLFKKQSSLLGTAFNGLLDIISTREYKMVKSCIANHKPFDKNVFNNAFLYITKVYPELYERTIQGWTVDAIKNEIYKKAKSYRDERYLLYSILVKQCPKIEELITFDENESTFENLDSFYFFLHYMQKHNDALLDDTSEACERYLITLAERRRREAEERRLALEEQAQQDYYDDDYSGGRSNDSSILKTAFGVALGNKMSGNSGRDRNAPQRKDYSNSASCTRKIRVKNGRILEKTCHGCTMAPYCTRYR